MTRKMVIRSQVDFKFFASLEKEIEILGTIGFGSEGLKPYIFLQGYSYVAPSIIFGENEFSKRLVGNKPSEHRPAPGAVDYAALFEVIAPCTLWNQGTKRLHFPACPSGKL